MKKILPLFIALLIFPTSFIFAQNIEATYHSIDQIKERFKTDIALNNELNKRLTKKYKKFEIKGLEVDVGCEGITINYEDLMNTAAIAYKQLVAYLPSYILKTILGLPDPRNPKEVAEFVFDMAAIAVCSGYSALSSTLSATVSTAGDAMEDAAKNSAGEEATSDAGNSQSRGAGVATTVSTTDTKNSSGQDSGQTTTDIAADWLSTWAGSMSTDFKECYNAYEEFKEDIANSKILFPMAEKTKKNKESNCDFVKDVKPNEYTHKLNLFTFSKFPIRKICTDGGMFTFCSKLGNPKGTFKAVFNQQAIRDQLSADKNYFTISPKILSNQENNSGLSPYTPEALRTLEIINDVITCINEGNNTLCSANFESDIDMDDNLSRDAKDILSYEDYTIATPVDILTRYSKFCSASIFQFYENKRDPLIFELDKIFVNDNNTTKLEDLLMSNSTKETFSRYYSYFLDYLCVSDYQIMKQNMEIVKEKALINITAEVEAQKLFIGNLARAWKKHESYFTDATDENITQMCGVYVKSYSDRSDTSADSTDNEDGTATTTALYIVNGNEVKSTSFDSPGENYSAIIGGKSIEIFSYPFKYEIAAYCGDDSSKTKMSVGDSCSKNISCDIDKDKLNDASSHLAKDFKSYKTDKNNEGKNGDDFIEDYHENNEIVISRWQVVLAQMMDSGLKSTIREIKAYFGWTKVMLPESEDFKTILERK